MSRYKGPRLKIIRRLGKLPGLTSKRSMRQKSDLKKNHLNMVFAYKQSKNYGIIMGLQKGN